MDKNRFFRDATLRICSSLEIEKALWNCLDYVKDYIPADRMSVHIYNPESGIMETIAAANPSGCEKMSVQGVMPSEYRKKLNRTIMDIIKKAPGAEIRTVKRLREDELTGPQARNLGWSDASGMIMGLILEGRVLGVLTVANADCIEFKETHVQLLKLLHEPFAVAMANSLNHRELSKLRDLLAEDNRYLRDELRMASGVAVVGENSGLRSVMEMVHRVAGMTSPVLLLGETGVGKEVIANTIHNLSYRKDGPFIKVNCGAIPESLMDSELFGHEKGAFTGAIYRKRGRFERAHGGTIFLDEIGELPQEIQIRLLRVLQEKVIERVGGDIPIKLDIRIIAATHRDLKTMLADGTFREDLYFRLSVFPIVIPPLRDRLIDIPSLVNHFIHKKCLEMGLPVPTPAPGAISRLTSYDWPGNVRELENAVERALILNSGELLKFDDILPAAMNSQASRPVHIADEALNLDDVISSHIRHVLELAGGQVGGEGGAAEMMGINPSTLRKRMRKLGVPFGRGVYNSK